jgi:monoamine oxidase
MEDNQENKKYDVVIVGAGIAGLCAAIKLKEEGKSFIIIEAQDHAGGRAISETTENGNVINVGANWLHGKDKDLLLPIAEELGLTIDKSDDAKRNVISFHEDKLHENSGSSFGLRSRIKHGAMANGAMRAIKMHASGDDISLQELMYGKDPTEEQLTLSKYMRIYTGSNSADDLSASQSLLDPYSPGGYQIVEGMSELIKRIIEEKVGAENIIYNSPVDKIIDNGDNTTIIIKDGESIEADRALFTGSIGVIHDNKISFENKDGKSLLTDEIQQQLSYFQMGNLAKLVWELDKSFINANPELKNRNIDFIDANPPMFVHVASSGKPIITAIFGGDDAVNLDKIAADPLQLESILSQLERAGTGLEDFRKYLLKEQPKIVQSCINNEYIQGAYSNCSVGGKNTGPLPISDNVILCGEAFAAEKSSYLSGAVESGRDAAIMAITQEIETPKSWIDNIKKATGELFR